MASQKTCDICYEDRFEFDFGHLPCAHSFCTTCLGKLMQDVCPMCRHPFNKYSQDQISREDKIWREELLISGEIGS